MSVSRTLRRWRGHRARSPAVGRCGRRAWTSSMGRSASDRRPPSHADPARAAGGAAPADHPLAALVPCRWRAFGEVVDENPRTPAHLNGRTSSASRWPHRRPLHAAARAGNRARGAGATLVRRGVPILTAIDHVDVPGGVVGRSYGCSIRGRWFAARSRSTTAATSCLPPLGSLLRRKGWLPRRASRAVTYRLPEPEAGAVQSR